MTKRDKFQDTLRTIFPGNDNVRLRDSLGMLRSSCSELQSLGTVLSEIFGTVENYKPHKRDEWEFRMVEELHMAMVWMSHIETSLLGTYTELRGRIQKRLAQAADMEKISKKQYQFNDRLRQESLRFEDDAVTDSRGPVREGVATATKSTEPPTEPIRHVGVDAPEAGQTGLVDSGGPDDGRIFAEAAGIFDE